MISALYWQHLETLLEQSAEHAEQLLSQPCSYMAPSRAQYIRLSKKTGPVLTKLLAFHVLSSLVGCKSPVAEWLGNVLQQFLPPPHSATVSTSWITFPLPVVQGKSSRMIHLLLGYTDGSSRSVSAPALATDCQEAISDARKAFSAFRLVMPGATVLFPLLVNDRFTLSGRSIGLAFSLALYLLNRGLSWPKGFFASGDLHSDGSIHPIDGLTGKQRLLPPGSCLLTALPVTSSENDQVTCLGSHDLGHAIDALEMHLLGTEPKLISRYQHLFVQPESLLHQFHDVPNTFFDLSNCRHRLAEIGNSPERYLPSAAGQLQRCSGDPPRAAILARLYRPDQLSSLVDKQPEMLTDAFAWCVGCIFLANHRGESASAWLDLHHSLQQRLSEEEQLVALNHRFVAERFNRYHFSMTLPDDISQLILEEEIRNRARFRVNRQLGAMYGTLAQNCGFCGPAYLPDLEYYIYLATQAFSTRYSTETRRLQIYHLYALLDGGRFAEVVRRLNLYWGLKENASPNLWLAVTCPGIGIAKLSEQYPLAITLRALADLGAVGYCCPVVQVDLPQSLLNLPETAADRRHHPWQLIAYNLGRICLQSGMISAAVRLLEHSLTICRENGETMRAMTLLACSELHWHNLAGDTHYSQVREVLKMLKDSRELYQDHFEPLLSEQDEFSSLSVVYEGRDRFFPFSYR